MNRATNSLPGYLTSRLLTESGFVHAFFTRQGGVSPAPFDSLNFASGGADSGSREANLELAAGVLGVARAKIYMPKQVHGVTCLTVSGAEDAQEFLELEGDAVLGARPDLACAVRSADCVSVLIGCVRTGRAAAVHAGWKGCVRGVIPSAIEALREAGATRLVAAMGPHISLAAFEVSEEAAAELVQASPNPDIVDRGGARPHVDLRRLARAQLRAAGLDDASVDDVYGCTVLEPDLFYSFRRDGEFSGRLLSAIVPRQMA